ncbi:hypothetical protein KIPB_012657, partial [Kipferlia bialata]|eukprot:g12657.t1
MSEIPAPGAKPEYFTIARKSKDQHQSINLLHELFSALTPDEKARVDKSKASHLMFMFQLLMTHLGAKFDDISVPRNKLEAQWIYNSVMEE